MSISVVIPFYNEEKYLAATLRSMAEQKRLPDQIVLIDNSSTDASLAIAESWRTHFEPCCEFILAGETRPGKVHALELAQTLCTGDWIAFCDADTLYPPHYLRVAEQWAKGRAGKGVVAIMATGLRSPIKSWSSIISIAYMQMRRLLFPALCHTGGYGQIFESKALRQSGGFSSAQWQYVLMDHEIVNRIHKYGRSLYPHDLYCYSSFRRNDRRKVKWSIFEQCIYFITGNFGNTGFFNKFLGPRFATRGFGHLNLREKSWVSKE